MIASGIVGGLIAAIFGLVDFLAIPSAVRYDAPMSPEAGAIVLSALSVALALFTGWLGGELVDRLAVGVDTGAHLDAPSSLSNRPATEHHRVAQR